MKRGCGWIVVFLLLTGCKYAAHPETAYDRKEDGSFTHYATGFDVLERDGYRIVRVFNPWQNSRGVTFSYVLVNGSAEVPDSLDHLQVIRVPVKRAITLSTTHVAMLHQLGAGSSIVGASGTGFIYAPALRSRIDSGMITDVGYDQGLNYETIVRLDPDVLFMYGVEGSERAVSEKLTELGIPVVFCGDYLEPYPLGKAEWIRFFSMFYGLEKQADRFFSGIDSSYRAMCDMVHGTAERPLVMTGLPWKDTWYVAGGKSYAAKLINDAGGDYLWRENRSAQAIPLDLESVYARAVEAQIWINPGAATSLEELIRFEERFADLPVLKKGMVFNNNRRLTPSGGNDYWESGSVRPDLVIADLIRVFHPELLEDHAFIYYRQLK